MNNGINKTQYQAVANQINKLLKKFHDETLKPSVSVLERGSDGLVILMNEDAYDLGEHAGYVQDLFYTGEVFVIGDNDFYLEPFDSRMVFKLAR